MISHGSSPAEREPDSFDVLSMVRDVFNAVLQYKWMVAFVCLLTLLGAGFYLYIWPPVYVAKANILVEREEDAARDDFYVQWNVFRKEDALTELQLIKATPILEEVIRREALTYDDIYRPVTSQLRYFWETSWPGRTYMDLKDRLFPSEDAFAPTPEMVDYGRTIDDFGEGITLLPVGDSYMGELRMKGPSPRVAQTANTLIDTYLEWRLAMHQEEADRAYEILASEAVRAQSELREIEQQRNEFVRSHGLLVGLQREMLQVDQFTNLEMDIARRGERRASLEATLRRIEERLAEEDAMQLVGSVESRSQLYEAARAKRLETEMSLIQARERYLEDSPEIQELHRVIANLDAIIENEPVHVQSGRTDGINPIRQELVSRRDQLESELLGIRAELEVMTATAHSLRSRLEQVPAIEAEFDRLNREHDLVNQKYDVLALRKAQADVSRQTVAATIPSLRVVSYALPPSSKTWPTIRIILPAALLAGLFLGSIAALIRYYASGYVRRADLLKQTGRNPMLGRVNIPTRGRPLTISTRPLTGSAAGRSNQNGT